MRLEAEPTVDTYDVSLDQQINALETSVTDDTPVKKIPKDDLIALHLNNVALLQNNPKIVEPKPLMVGLAYAPSVQSLNDLQKICFADLRPEVHHRGCFVTARTITPSYLTTQTITIIEEEGGDVAKLEIGFQDPSLPDSDLPPNSTVAIKEPYFKYIKEGDFAIHVDHPSDIAILRGDDPAVSMIMEVVSQKKEISALEWKVAGDRAYLEKNFSSAIECYTQAIDNAPKEDDAFLRSVYRKRAYANLTGKRFDVALKDALESSEGCALDEKDYHCAGRAAYGLGLYEDAKSYFEQALESNPINSKYINELNRTKTRISEREKGIYDFRSMGESLTKNHIHLDHADFIKNTTIKLTERKGRGLFATQPIQRGDLVLCEKALHFPDIFRPEGLRQNIIYNFNVKTRTQSTGQSSLFLGLIHKLYNNPLLTTKFFELDSGEYVRTGKEGELVDGVPIIDVFLIEAIRLKNGFSYYSNRQPSSSTSPNKSITASKSDPYAGLWIRASILNHSCVPNCSRSFIGDMMILRAICDIPSGTELTHHYTSPEASFSVRQEAFAGNWKFECDCPLCETERKSPSAKREKRIELAKQIRDVATKHTHSQRIPEFVIRKVERLLTEAEALHEPSIYSSIPRLLLVHPTIWLATAHRGKRNFSKTAKYALEILRNFGFVNPLRDGKLCLEYEKGIVNSEVFNAVQFAMEAFRGLGRRDLERQCEEEARKLFGIITGDSEGFEDEISGKGGSITSDDNLAASSTV